VFVLMLVNMKAKINELDASLTMRDGLGDSL
jgi:hypothetical protein